MSDVSEAEAQQLASAFRPNRKPLIIAIAANGLLALLLLGIPYWRGRNLAAAERREFAAFARCLIGGEPAKLPGLSLPRGDRDHFAAKVLFADGSWPLSCRPALRKLEASNAIFLWPSVKQAGSDVNAALGLVDRELVKLDERRKRGVGRVPQRPLEALKRLQAAMVLYARAAGVDADLDNDAIRFDRAAAGLATPARLPLMAGESSVLALWSSEVALEALALDGRGLSYLKLADGKIDRERIKRGSYVRGVLRAGMTPYVVWATPEARCRDREDRCAGRPAGLARYAPGGHELGEPTWKLSGHPAGRVDRVLQVSELGKVELIARASADGALEWLRFRLPNESQSSSTGPGQTKAVALEATERFAVRSAGPAANVQLLPGEDGGAVFYAAEQPSPAPAKPSSNAGALAANPSSAPQVSSGSSAQSAKPASESAPEPAKSASGAAANPASASAADAPKLGSGNAWAPAPARPLSGNAAAPGPQGAGVAAQANASSPSVAASLVFPGSAAPLQLPAASGSGPWAIGCTLGSARFLAYGSTSQLRIARVDGAHAVKELSTVDRALRPPLDLDDPARDQLRLVCEGERAQLLFNTQSGVLEQLSCDAESCGAPVELARDVSSYAALANGDDLIVAFAGFQQAAVVRVLRADRSGTPRGQPITPSACWEPLGGMCGIPTLTRDTQRIVLTARDGADLLALESTDRAQTFTTLSGLVVGGSFEPSTTSPLQQHRIRKGLD